MIKILNIQDKNGYGLMHGHYDVLAELQDNCTNGDIIKAMFPNIKHEVVRYTKYIGESKIHGTEVVIDTSIRFEEDWWNAPYKKAENETKQGLNYADQDTMMPAT